MIQFDDFLKIDIYVGTVLSAEDFPKARKPAYKLRIDFGETIGVKKSSAQITDYYTKEALVGKQIMAVTNFPPRQIADFWSEVLDRKSTRLNSSHLDLSRMPSSA